MIRIYGVKLCTLPKSRELLHALPRDWAEAWEARHRQSRNDRMRRQSLAGLLLAQLLCKEGTLAYDPDGRPYLEGRQLDFNITHTEDYAFCAVEEGEGARVGIDAEAFERAEKLRHRELANRWFSEAELLAFDEAPSDTRFLDIWTRKEALVKWSGEGLRALRRSDTERAKERYGVVFTPYTVEETRVMICHRADAEPPKEIVILDGSALL